MSPCNLPLPELVGRRGEEATIGVTTLVVVVADATWVLVLVPDSDAKAVGRTIALVVDFVEVAPWLCDGSTSLGTMGACAGY